MTNLTDIIDRWNSAEGKPYKGKLIDMEAYAAAPENIGCMCAQGQILHLLAGWTPDMLEEKEQSKADAETAKLLNISRAHAVLLRNVNDRDDGAPAVVLTDPEKVLGDKWSDLLNFWWYLDGITKEQWDAARTAARTTAGDAAWDAAWDAAGDAAEDAAQTAAWTTARDAAKDAAWDAAWATARDAAKDAAWTTARTAAWAANEIQGTDILRKSGTPLFFLPAFGFSSPDDIPARPAGYGKA